MRAIILTLLLCALATGCAATGRIDTQSVLHDPLDPATARTYRLTTTSVLPSPLQRTIDAELHRALQARGLTPSDTPALEVRYFAVVHDETHAYAVPDELLRQHRLGYQEWPAYETHLYQVTEGTLLVDLVDVSNHALVWEGQARGALERGRAARNRERLAQAIDVLLRDFPLEHLRPAAGRR